MTCQTLKSFAECMHWLGRLNAPMPHVGMMDDGDTVAEWASIENRVTVWIDGDDGSYQVTLIESAKGVLKFKPRSYDFGGAESAAGFACEMLKTLGLWDAK